MTTVSIQVSQVKFIDLNFTEKILPFFQFLLNDKCEVPFQLLLVLFCVDHFCQELGESWIEYKISVRGGGQNIGVESVFEGRGSRDLFFSSRHFTGIEARQIMDSSKCELR